MTTDLKNLKCENFSLINVKSDAITYYKSVRINSKRLKLSGLIK